jgi:hypothetical protein
MMLAGGSTKHGDESPTRRKKETTAALLAQTVESECGAPITNLVNTEPKQFVNSCGRTNSDQPVNDGVVEAVLNSRKVR